MSKVPPIETTDSDVGAAGLAPPGPVSLPEAAFEARKRADAEIIQAALDKHRWNRRRAAEALNISYHLVNLQDEVLRPPQWRHWRCYRVIRKGGAGPLFPR